MCTVLITTPDVVSKHPVIYTFQFLRKQSLLDQKSVPIPPVIYWLEDLSQ